MSQAELARRIGTKQPAIARIESGEANVTLKTIRALAKALDATARVEMAGMEALESKALLSSRNGVRRVAEK